MPEARDTYGALVEALDLAIDGLTTARKLAARLQHSPTTRRRSRSVGSREDDPFSRAFQQGIPVDSRSIEEVSASVHEAAEKLGIGEEQVRRLLRSGELIGVPYGGRRGWRISRDYLDDLAAQRRLGRGRNLQPA
jgi:excisionase family DNA binding protein